MKYVFIIVFSVLLCVPLYAGDKTSNAQEIKLPTLIDFGASKCVACQKMTVILDGLEKSYSNSLKVKFIDVWKRENVAQAEQFKIQRIPTQVFLSPKGEEVWRHIGFISEEDILAKWKELGFKVKAKKVNKDKNASKSGDKTKINSNKNSSD